MKQYNIYPTLLDSFTNYLNSSVIYQQFWGSSEAPTLTEEEYERQAFQDLINRINRVPFESEAADKGTAFNEIIDCIVEGRKSTKIDIHSEGEVIMATINGRQFAFSKELAKSIANPLKEENALTQYRVEGTISTQYGEVFLYGYLDYLLPFKVVDLKTTGKYNAFKYRNNWQHIVYPYCLNQQGIEITDFEYLVTDFKGVYKEAYAYMPKLDIPRLRDICERFIEFLESNRELITDKKIFNEQTANEHKDCLKR